jgi:hypothetical protein
MALHEKTVVDPLHSKDTDQAALKHPESNAVPFEKKPAHKENHDEELQEISLREFGKVSTDSALDSC